MVRRPETAGPDGVAPGELRTGYTTGACATAGATAAYARLLTGAWPDPVAIHLPKAPPALAEPRFALVERASGPDWALAAVEKDAGDDPDVTHGAVVRVTVRLAEPGAGVRFVAGEGVGTVTKPGLPIPPGEPAVNPAPRALMRDAVARLAAAHGAPGDVEIEIAVAGGAALAAKTWNPRLGVVGGLSILGTTGIVRPYSCAAWIASIHRGVDVVRAAGAEHAVGATGNASEAAAQALYGLPDWAMLDMGDFAGGLLKYLRDHPIPRLTLAGGFAKMTKLAQGALDLHSKRSQVDFAQLAALAAGLTPDPGAIAGANTAQEALERVGSPLAARVAAGARETARAALRGSPVRIETLIVDRAGRIVARTDAGP